MKKYNCLITSLIAVFFLVFDLHPQSIMVHNMIGKHRNEVIKAYGNPIHKDDSNPSMICMFYKSKDGTMIFVSNKDGIYQAEATKSFQNEDIARTEIDLFISNSIENGFIIDTVTVYDFNIIKKGNKVELQLCDNKLTNSFDIRVKAKRVMD